MHFVFCIVSPPLHFMKKALLAVFYLLLFAPAAPAQTDTSALHIYKVNRKWELPVSAGFLAVSYAGFRELDDVATLSAEQVMQLHPD